MKPNKDELFEHFDALSDDNKRRVLEFAKGLTKTRPKGTPGNKWMRLAGIIDPESLKEMETAIEEGCEKVNATDW